MSLMFGFGGRGGLVQFLFGTPIGPRQITLGEIAGRKALKGAVRDMMPAEDSRKKSGENHPVLEKLAFYSALANMSAFEKEAPFKSEAQRRKFYAMESRGEISKKEVRKWERETTDKDLPDRIHKKEAGSLIVKGVGLLAKGVMGTGKVALKAAKPVGKAMFLPTTRMQGAVGNALWSTHSGVSAAKAYQPMAPSLPQMRPMATASRQPLQMAASVDELIEMTKQAALASAVAKPMSRVAKPIGHGMPDSWLKRSTTGTSQLNVAADAPKALAIAGDATLQRAGAGSNVHIQR
jgi:hypothetical protein